MSSHNILIYQPMPKMNRSINGSILIIDQSINQWKLRITTSLHNYYYIILKCIILLTNIINWSESKIRCATF